MRRKTQRDPHPALNYRPPQALRRTRVSVAVLLSTALAVGVWSLLWYGALSWVQIQVRDWVNTQLTRGGVVTYADYEVSGYPSRIVLRFIKPHYSGMLVGERVDWRGDSLVLSAPLWRPWRLRAKVPGRFDLRLTDRKMKFTGQAKVLGVSFVPGRGWRDNLVLDVQKLNMSGTAPVAIEDLSLRSERDDDTLSLALAGRGWTLPLRGGWGLGDQIDSFDARVRIRGRFRPRVTFKASLASWRDAGGNVQIKRLNARAGPFALSTTGTLTLDRDFQPVGAFTAKMKGLFSVLEILRTQGLIRGPNAVLATMALSAFSTRPQGGGAASINLSVTVKNGHLSLGPVSVAKVPRINWGFVKKTPKKAPPRNYKDAPPVY